MKKQGRDGMPTLILKFGTWWDGIVTFHVKAALPPGKGATVVTE